MKGFKSLDEAKEYAESLLKLHGLTHVKITFNTKRTSVIAMACYKINEIQLSTNWYKLNLKNVDFIKNNILHEIAHFKSKGDGHGKHWKQACADVGAIPEKFGSVKNFKHKSPATKRVKYGTRTKLYEYKCPLCGETYFRKRKMKDHSCGVCWKKVGTENCKIVLVKEYI